MEQDQPIYASLQDYHTWSKSFVEQSRAALRNKDQEKFEWVLKEFSPIIKCASNPLPFYSLVDTAIEARAHNNLPAIHKILSLLQDATGESGSINQAIYDGQQLVAHDALENNDFETCALVIEQLLKNVKDRHDVDASDTACDLIQTYAEMHEQPGYALIYLNKMKSILPQLPRGKGREQEHVAQNILHLEECLQSLATASRLADLHNDHDLMEGLDSFLEEPVETLQQALSKVDVENINAQSLSDLAKFVGSNSTKLLDLQPEETTALIQRLHQHMPYNEVILSLLPGYEKREKYQPKASGLPFNAPNINARFRFKEID